MSIEMSLPQEREREREREREIFVDIQIICMMMIDDMNCRIHSFIQTEIFQCFFSCS